MENMCIICFEQVINSNLQILQQCNCVYDVCDTCIYNWYRTKNECLICHKKISLCKFKKTHIPYVNSHSLVSNDNRATLPITQETHMNEGHPLQDNNTMPPRMSAFKRLFGCCF